MTEAYIPPVSWYCDLLRPMVLGKSPQTQLPIGGFTAILQHLEDLAKRNGERTIGAITADLYAAKGDDVLTAHYRNELGAAEAAAAARAWA